MYAVIFSGGKQYRVQEGDILKIESLPDEIGSEIKFEKVLLVGQGNDLQLGNPYIEGCSVSATVLAKGRGEKVHIIKFRRRKHHEKWQGHRQDYTEVKIGQIKAKD